MKKILLLTLFITFSFAKIGAYVSYDLSADWKASSGNVSVDDSMDAGALTIGYEMEVFNFMKVGSISAGASYDVIGMDDGYNYENQFFNIYGKYFYSIGYGIKIWGSLGYNMPQGDLKDFDDGISYGLGLSMDNGISLGYSFNNVSFEVPGQTTDWVISRISVSYGF